MEEQKDKDKTLGGWCPWCLGYGHGGQDQGPYHHHWHPGFFILRIVIAILAIVFAFAVGFKLGELRASVYYGGYDGYNYTPMQYMSNGWGGTGGSAGGYNYGPYGQYPYGYGMPMMRYYYNYGVPIPAQSAPAPAPAATSTTK